MTGMPYSAVATGLVDHLLPVSAMPAKLLDYQQSLRERHERRCPMQPARRRWIQRSSPRSAPCCANAPATISANTSKPTLLRRIRRRMQAHGHRHGRTN